MIAQVFLTICWIALCYFIINGVLAIVIGFNLLDEIKLNPQDFKQELISAAKHPIIFILTVIIQRYFNLIGNIIILMDFKGQIKHVTQSKKWKQ